jgi:hypothetical protein
MTLGTAPALTLATARKTAAELHARVRLGEDPAASKREGQRRAADTVEAILRLYLPAKKETLAPRSYIEVERYLLRYARPLHGLGATLVSRRDIGALLAVKRRPDRQQDESLAVGVLCVVHGPRPGRTESGHRHTRRARAVTRSGAVHCRAGGDLAGLRRQ